MTIDMNSVIAAVANLRTLLDQWGVTTEMLLAAAAVSTLFSLLSLREVLLWFFRVNHLRDDVKTLRLEVQELRHSLEKMQNLLIQQSVQDVPKPAVKASSGDAPVFRFDH